LPLSFAQQRLWFIHQFAPESAAYNMPHPLRLRGALDVGALRRSLAALVARHEALRTVFAVVDGEPVQVVHDDASVTLPVADLSGLAAAARDAETRRLIGEETLRPFDLARGPLMRALLLRAGAEEHAVLFTLHHIVADGWSLGVLVREVSALYGAFSLGEAPRLAPLPIQYGDYAAWQRAWLAGEALERQVGWWRERLAGAPPLLEVPTDRPRPVVMSEAGASRPFALSAEVSAALAELSRREGATLFMTLLAGWQALLSRWSGQTDVVVGTPLAGRTRLETEGLIGMFVNTLALRAELRDGADFRALLGQVRETTLGAYAHQEVPFEKLVEELRVERSLRYTPIFQALFALQNIEPGTLEMGAVEVEPLSREEETAKFDLSLVLAEEGGRLGGVLSYRAALWEPATIGRMTEHLRVLLEGIAAAPERPVAELPLMPAEERAQVLERWNATAADRPRGLGFHELFEAHARRAPDAPALVFAGATVSYAELDHWGERLAGRLRGLGVGPEARVGVCLERGPALVASLLGVLKAGGAYVPLDPEYPADRLAFMLADSGVRVVVTHGALAERLPGFDGEVVLLDGIGGPGSEAESAQQAAASGDAPISHPPTPDNLAYVIYTSGSTGTPKGVLVPHDGLCNVARAQARDLGVGPDDRVLQLASPSFDASVFEVAMALGSGAALVLGTRDELVPGPELVRLLREQGVTAAVLSPSALGALPEADLPALRTLMTAGEACPAELVDRWAPGRRFLNLYGPTEATIWSTTAACRAGGGTPPIGRPVANTAAYVLDGAREPVPVGVPGELYVGGAGVARGYGGRPELTAARFVPDPFGGGSGARLYRTGDRVRWLPRGELEFLGRVDAQVKVRGFRVEPGEVEAALRAHPGVADAAVVAREDEPGRGAHRLVAYVVARGGAAPETAGLRAHLRERLPEHMVPSAFVALERLPLTPNGKLDRAALPAPDTAAGGREYVAPRTPLEEVLAAIYAEVLRTEPVGIHDDFFELGGHSLLATRVASRVREAFGVEMPVRVLFEAPSVAALGERVSTLQPTARVEDWEMEEEMAKLAELSEEEVQRLLREI
ncbi:MAG: amino acid adenylation domain-containing protein, partial [Longimicrobiaceae bacterium]